MPDGLASSTAISLGAAFMAHFLPWLTSLPLTLALSHSMPNWQTLCFPSACRLRNGCGHTTGSV
eukprot:6203092-Heterocapsa_arctica.AAC.1